MVQIFGFSHDLLDLYALPYFIVAVLILALGVFVFSHNQKSLSNLSYLCLCSSVFLWLICNYFAISAQDPKTGLFFSKTVYIGVTLIPPSMYFFAVAWLDLFKRRKLIVALNYFIGFVFIILFLFTNKFVVGVYHHFFGYFSKLSRLSFLYLLYFFCVSVAFFGTLFQAYRKEANPTKKVHIRYILIAFTIAFVGSVDFMVSFGVNIYPISFLSVAFFVVIVAYTIISYKLMNIETVIHKTLMWAGSTVIAILPFGVLLYYTQHWARKLPTYWATAYYLVMIISFYSYFRLVQPILSHFFRRNRANLEKIASDFSKELVHLKDLRDLLKRFARLLQQTIYAKQISVYLMDESRKELLPSLAKGLRSLNPYSTNHPFLSWLERQDEVVVGDFIEGNPEVESFKDEVRSYLTSQQALVVIPFVHGGELIGLVHLGKKENFRKYTLAELNFLSQIKAPFTVALSNSKQFESVSRLYEQVQKQNERLKELDRLKTEFLANTSHELKTPLHGILGLVESMLDGADGLLSDSQRIHLRMIVESGSSLKELINNLLELSRIESGQAKFNVKAFNILNAIDAVIVLLENLARKKNISVERVVPPSLPDIFGDPEKIQRVLVNLIGNAIKFTERGKVTVRVLDDQNFVRVSVEDTGVGIAPEDQELIFERFRQAEGGETRRFEGTGLGLSIAREIMRLHGSDIWVESKLGQGSTFSLLLPKDPALIAKMGIEKPAKVFDLPSGVTLDVQGRLPQRELEAQTYGSDPEYSLEKDAEFQEAVRGDGERILIIDDNAINREVIRTRLELNNYEVIEAVDGVDGLEKMAQGKPNLIILDLMMPRMSGYEFCRKARAQFTSDEIPIIMLTAKTDMGDKIYGLQLGANDYVSKPFNKEELIARIGVLLKIRQMTQELKRWNEELEKRVDERTEELVRTQQQLIQAEKLATIGTLAGGVAHEINNPLTAVLTSAQILKMTIKSEDEAESVNLIEEGAKRCQAIVQKLMKYARKPANEEQLKGEVDLNRVIENTLNLVGYQLEQESIHLIKHLHPIPKIKGVPNELEQVFTNLVLNAKDAVKALKSSGSIEIETFERNGSICASVKDDGIGIPKDHLSKIFDPFFTTKEIGKGTGLGLSIIHGIVERHGGKIEVSSKKGVGSTFIVAFPKTLTQPSNESV